ncbi:MAG: hypothetical protein WBQ08_03335 [Candidatus Sulfotelmatobacter sp.]
MKAGLTELRMKQVRDFARIFLATLREIFDEAPYARFLQRTQAASSPQAYAAFCREQEQRHARRPRCC